MGTLSGLAQLQVTEKSEWQWLKQGSAIFPLCIKVWKGRAALAWRLYTEQASVFLSSSCFSILNIRLSCYGSERKRICCCCLVISVMSDSVRLYGLQSARLLYPRDSLGKSTEVGCHAVLQEFFPAQGSNPGLLHCRQDSFTTEPPGKLEVGHILYIYWSESCSVMPDCLQHMDCVHGILQARILGSVAVPFSRESSQPRDWTQVSWIADRFFTSWAMREYRYWDFLEIVCDCSFPLAWPKWSYLATVGCKEGWIRWCLF